MAWAWEAAIASAWSAKLSASATGSPDRARRRMDPGSMARPASTRASILWLPRRSSWRRSTSGERCESATITA